MKHWGDFGVFFKLGFQGYLGGDVLIFQALISILVFHGNEMVMKWFQLKIEKYFIQRWGDISCIMHCKAHPFFIGKQRKQFLSKKVFY